MKVERTGSVNVTKVSGRIDSTNSEQFEINLLATVDKDCKDIHLDLEDLDYISSAGLRVLMKLRKVCCGSISLINTSEEVSRILEMTGFNQLFVVKKAYRRISVDGCPVIGKGFYGTVYRIDADTVVKVYESADSIPLIENEQRMAKAAFLKGLPTAISYDIVKVGEQYGSVFEMLKAISFNDLLIQYPEKKDDIIRRWCDLLKQVHQTQMEPGTLPSARQRFIDYLTIISPYLGDWYIHRLKELFMNLPDTTGVIHGDFQMKNVMLSGDEPMLIDMDTLAAGHPIFDFAGLYVTYIEFEEDDPGNSVIFYGITKDTCDYIWHRLLELYFDTTNPQRLQEFTDKIRIVAAVRFLYILTISNLKDGELGRLRIQHTQEQLDDLLSRINNLIL